jgi:hypothetical protein
MEEELEVEVEEEVEDAKKRREQKEYKEGSKAPAILVAAILLGAIAGALAGFAVSAFSDEESETYTETDPEYGASAAAGITSVDITDWNTAHSWGDHSTVGYLTSVTETDPIYGVSAASGISSGDITNWNTAHGWGDHSTDGYLTSYTETDPVYDGSVASGISSGDVSNWNTAHGWGDHSTVGYLTSYSETDPVYDISVASGITSGNITNWDSAYGWGDHSIAGYLTSYTETDPEVGSNTLNYVPMWNGSALVSGTLYDNGNVGIGTTSPLGKLHVVNGNVYVDNNGYGGTPMIDLAIGDADTGLESPSDGRLDIYSDDNIIMTIMNNNVGIGTTGPLGKLHVVNGSLYVDNNGFGGTPSIDLAVGDTDTGLNSSGDGQLDFFSDNINTMSIRSGNVGIGTTSPSQRLHVDGNISYTGELTKLDVADNFVATVRAADFKLGHSSRRGTPGRALADQTTTLHLNFGNDWATTRIDGTTTYISGDVGIGVATPSTKLDVAGTVTATEFQDSTPVAFHALNGADDAYTSSGIKIVELDGEIFDHGNNFNTGNDRFYAPTSGVYQFNAVVTVMNVDSGDTMSLFLYKNGLRSKQLDRTESVSSTALHALSGSTTLNLGVGDYIDVRVEVNVDTSWSIKGNSFQTHFSGHRVA